MSFRSAHSFLVRAKQASHHHLRRRHSLERLEDRWTMDGTLAISEIMYAPPPSFPGGTDGGEFEFIELQNVGDATLSLSGYQFTVGITYVFPAFDLAPGAFVVVPKNRDTFLQRYPSVDVNKVLLGWNGTQQLANGGEELVLQGPAGIVAQFEYDNAWYPITDEGGFSLVAVTPGVTTPAPSQKAHWRPSGASGGSPGAQDGGLAPGAVLINELLSHSDIDTVGDWIELKNTTNAPIDVGGWFMTDTPSEPMRYRIPFGTIIPAGGFVTFTQYEGLLVPSDFFKADPTNPNSVPFQFTETGETVVLTQADAQGNFLGYRVEQSFGAADREFPFGRYLKSTGGTDFTTMLQNGTRGAENGPPLIGPIVINELLYAPLGTEEFIELRNITNQPVPLFHPTETTSTWKFINGVQFEFPQGQVIPANGYALVVPVDPTVYRQNHPGIPANVPIYGPYVGALADGGEEIQIAKPGDRQIEDNTVPYYVLDRVNYSTSPPWPDGTNNGPSLARKVPNSYGNDGANWAPGVVGGTPGAPNSTTTTVSAENTTVEETDSAGVQAFVTVRLSDPSTQVVTVSFTTRADEATTPGDFVEQSGVLTFAVGETVQVVTVAVNGDLIDEPNEDFDVVLSNPSSSVTLGDDTGQITITDNDPLPSLTISDPSAVEGDGGIPSAVVTLTLSAASEKTITLQFATADGSATSPTDYASASGTITFLPNTPSQTITIPLVGDEVTESNETFVVNFSAPTAVSLPDTQSIVTIVDDDSAHPWQNPVSRWDVDNANGVGALDVLILVNRINATGGGPLPAPSASAPPPYYDVDGNGNLEALDVLNVVNFINAQPPQLLAAMGLAAPAAAESAESDAPIAPPQDDVVLPAASPRSIASASGPTSCSASFADDELPVRVAAEVEAALVELLQ